MTDERIRARDNCKSYWRKYKDLRIRGVAICGEEQSCVEENTNRLNAFVDLVYPIEEKLKPGLTKDEFQEKYKIISF